MTRQDVLDTLAHVLRDVLGDATIALGDETRRSDVPGWDSFAYVNFIVAAEMELGVKFRIADVESFETVGDIVTEALKLTQRSA
jgi:acyl carrier protein